MFLLNALEITNVNETDTDIMLSTTYEVDFLLGKNYTDINYVEPDSPTLI